MSNELLTPQEMHRVDELAHSVYNFDLTTLMEAAGQAVANEILQRFSRCHVAVLCGPGHNGGDGFVVARLLAAKKWPVSVFITVEKIALHQDVARVANRWRGPMHPFAGLGEAFAGKSPPRLIVDAIYGAGLNREFPKNWAEAIMSAKTPVVAIDVPSGLDGATGCPVGNSVVANLTVTFFRKKPGHVLMPGRVLCGEIVVADIGLPAAVLNEIQTKAFENAAPTLPAIDAETHKFLRGYAAVISGPELATGASRLAALAAARTGAGLTCLIGPSDALRIHAAHVSSILLKKADTHSELLHHLSDERITAICIGPAAGLGAEVRQKVLVILEQCRACVLDADALSVFADRPDELFTAIQLRPERACVMTPHDGEFARLFPDLVDNADSKIAIAKRAAQRSGAVVIMKGADTVIAEPGGLACVNTNAPAKLATAGSGDVLAGLITGLLAQGLPAFQAACAGVWFHGDAANRMNRKTIIAEDLIAEIMV